jgi:hypothetical protein
VNECKPLTLGRLDNLNLGGGSGSSGVRERAKVQIPWDPSLPPPPRSDGINLGWRSAGSSAPVRGQGLTLVHSSAQLELCLTHKSTFHTLNTP